MSKPRKQCYTTYPPLFGHLYSTRAKWIIWTLGGELTVRSLWIIWLAFIGLISACSTAVPLPRTSSIPAMVFAKGDGNIYIRFSDGRVSRITNGTGAAWTPDHKMLIVDRNPVDSAVSDLWLVTLHGKTVRQITSTYPNQVRFFAAGEYRRRSFVAYDMDKPGIQIVSLNGSGRRAIPIPATIDYLDISADGSKIVFDKEYMGGRTLTGLYIINSDGRGRPRLVIADNTHREVACPAFSPDGQWIAFSMSVFKGYGNETAAVWIIHPNGTGMHMLASGAYSPTWSPDGSWIAYTGRSRGHLELFKIRPDGTDRSSLMRFAGDGPGNCFNDQPTW